MSARTREPRRAAVAAARRPTRLATLLPWIVLAAGLLLALVVRIRVLDMPLERDEGEYAYAGQLILEGHPPYGELDNMKLPGTYYAYALIMAVLGQTARGIHLGLVLWTTASALLLFALGRKLLDPLAGAVAAACFATMSMSPRMFGLAGHATHFVVLPMLAGCWGILWPGRRERLGLALAGLAFGVAFLMKQQAAALMLFGLLFVLWRSRARGVRTSALHGALFSAGAIAPYLGLCLYLAAAGVFRNFWFWTVTYARRYVSLVSLSDAPRALLDKVEGVAGPNTPMWLLAAAGAVLLLVRHRDRDVKVFLSGLAVFSFLAVCPGFFFREHYFLVMLPAVGLLAGAGATALVPSGERGGTGEGPRVAWAVATVLAVASAAVWQREAFFEWNTIQLSRYIYWRNPFPESLEIARYIEANTSPDDRVAVLGSEPQIYFYSHRRSASRYVYAYALMEAHSYASELQDQVIRELEAARPKIMVMVRVSTSWLSRPESDKKFVHWIESYVPPRYDLVGLIEIYEDAPTRYIWGAEAAVTKPSVESIVAVLKRKD